MSARTRRYHFGIKPYGSREDCAMAVASHHIAMWVGSLDAYFNRSDYELMQEVHYHYRIARGMSVECENEDIEKAFALIRAEWSDLKSKIS
jgi:hypothetical protein